MLPSKQSILSKEEVVELLSKIKNTADFNTDEYIKNKDTLCRTLLTRAKEATQYSYAPYSNFYVGAALLAGNGEVFLGCNVENASYGAAICAERTALTKAISSGVRDFLMIAVYATKAAEISPCGICRQFIFEFGPHIEIIMSSSDGNPIVMSINELLPKGFGPADLSK